MDDNILKLMVCGSRTITDRTLIFTNIDKFISENPDKKIIIIEKLEYIKEQYFLNNGNYRNF